MQYQTKLYIDTGFGFNEKESISKTADAKDELVRFDLNEIDNIKRLRFDPSEHACVLSHVALYAVHEDMSREKLAIKNEDEIKSGQFILLLNDDPKLIVANDLEGMIFKALRVELKFHPVEVKLLNSINGHYSSKATSSIAKKNLPIASTSNSDLSEVKNLIANNLKEKESKIIELENELKLNSSKSNKIIEDLKRQIASIERSTKLETEKLNKKIVSEVNQRANVEKQILIVKETTRTENDKIQSSMSYKLGFLLTGPVRYLHDKFNFKKFKRRAKALVLPPKEDQYDVWLQKNKISQPLRKLLIQYAQKLEYQPLISVVIPVYNVDAKWLNKLVLSMQRQVYRNWEVCFADDKSPKDHIVPYLKNINSKDERFKFILRKENGNISEATNSAIGIAQGEFILFMDNDDELHENAIYEVVQALNKDRTIDMLYSDEDKIDEENKRYNHHFKPDYSPEYLLSYNYINHLLVVRKTLVDKVKGFRQPYDGTQDYDFILRVIEHTTKVHHIPKVLYHWRALETSIAGSGASKVSSLNFFEKGRKTLQDYLIRNNIKGDVIQPGFAVDNNLGLYEVQWPDSGPKISIITLLTTKFEEFEQFLTSLGTTKYKNIEVHVLHEEPLESIGKFPKTEFKLNFQKVSSTENIAKLYNAAVNSVDGEFLLFMDDRLLPKEDNWLSQLTGLLQIEKVGAVMPKLYFMNGRICNAGIIDGMYPANYDGLPYNTFRNSPAKNLGYFFNLKITRNYNIPIRECFVTRKSLFEEVGGFDGDNFDIDFFSFDYGHKITEKGYRTVFNASAELEFQVPYIGKGLQVKEAYHYKKKYMSFDCDSMYNANLDRTAYMSLNNFSSQKYYKDFKELQSPHVLFVSQNFNFEGAPIQMKETIEGLMTKANYRVTVISPSDGPLREEFEKIGATTHVIDFILEDSLGKYEKQILKLSKFIKKGKYDLLYVNTLLPFYAIDAAQRHNIPCVWVIHESYDINDFYSYFKHDIKKRAVKCFEYIETAIFVAKSTKSLFNRFDYNNTFKVINNALRTELNPITITPELKKQSKEQLGFNPEKLLFLNLGTVCERKGQYEFTQAALDFLSSGETNVTFCMVGAREDEYLETIQELIHENKAEEYFEIVFETNKVESYYLAADVFVCTSKIESYPRVILEAMYYELPIITTSVFGIKEQLVPKTNGEFYQVGSMKQLSSLFLKFAYNQNLRSKYSENARYVLGLINTYDEMIHKYHEILMAIHEANYNGNVIEDAIVKDA